MKIYPIIIGNKAKQTHKSLTITSPYNGETVGQTYLAQEEEIEEALLQALRAFMILKQLPTYAKVKVLLQISHGLKERAEELAHLMALEAAKPISLARIEVTRCIELFQYAAEELKRFGGEIIPLDFDKLGENRLGIYKHFPVGPILGITPFNFPLNLVAHKVAPALAVGNPIIIKPASATPLTALTLGEIISQTDLPEGSISILPCQAELAERMVRDDRLVMLTFTGSPDVGWYLKSIAGKKRLTLELGGNAGLIISSLRFKDFLLERSVFGSFYQAGQVCISVQRIFVKENIYKDFIYSFLDKLKGIHTGDPLDEKTLVGPLINEKAAKRVMSWIEEALDGGAKLVIGGKREDNIIYPTVLTNTRAEMKVNAKEVFGPVVTIEGYRKFSQAIDAINNSTYGLQTGVFTDDLNEAFCAYNQLEVGGVIINDVPTYRSDPMPYGGTKASGLGKEGVKYAINEMSEGKILVIKYA
jgi:glyceraldehyde-3-phosphate dehydrogenase (NADP+)